MTTTITQIQIGCVLECFGSNMSDPAIAGAAQQLLTELTAILSPPAPPSTIPIPALEQSATALTSCQQQYGQGSTVTQVQTASQSSTTIQVVNLAAGLTASMGPASGGAQPAVQAAGQTVQLTWQLQIGCLFYCVDTQQLQQAQESATTVVVIPGESTGSAQLVGSTPAGSTPAGSTGAVVTVVTQVIWQVQIGCLAWCYDSTQMQQATTRSSVVVIVAPPPGTDAPPTTPPAPAGPPPSPSTPGDAPATGASAGAGPTGVPGGAAPAGTAGGPAPEGSAAGAGPATPPFVSPHAGPVPVAWPRLGLPLAVTRAMLTSSIVRPAPTPAQPIAPTSTLTASSQPLVSREPAPAASGIVRSRERVAVAPAARGPVRHSVSSGAATPAAVVQARASDGGAGEALRIVGLALVLLAALSYYAIRRARAGAGLER